MGSHLHAGPGDDAHRAVDLEDGGLDLGQVGDAVLADRLLEIGEVDPLLRQPVGEHVPVVDDEDRLAFDRRP